MSKFALLRPPYTGECAQPKGTINIIDYAGYVPERRIGVLLLSGWTALGMIETGDNTITAPELIRGLAMSVPGLLKDAPSKKQTEHEQNR